MQHTLSLRSTRASLATLFLFITMLAGHPLHTIGIQLPQAILARIQRTQIHLCLLGIGARYLFSMLSKKLLEDREFQAAIDKKIPSRFIEHHGEKEQREILAHAVTSAGIYATRSYIEHILQEYLEQLTKEILKNKEYTKYMEDLGEEIIKQMSGTSQEIGFTTASAIASAYAKAEAQVETTLKLLFGEAFGAGSLIQPALKSLLRSGKTLAKLAPTVATLTQETGYALLDNAKRTLGNFLDITMRQPASEGFAYPLTFGHTTALACTKNDPYCLAQEKREAEQELQSNPDVIAFALVELLGTGAEISAGFAAAALSYIIGTELLPIFKAFAEELVTAKGLIVPSEEKTTFFDKLVMETAQKSLRQYAQLAIVVKLYNLLLTAVEQSRIAYDGKKILTINQDDFNKAFFQGLHTRLQQKSVYPVEKKFLAQLLHGPSIELTIKADELIKSASA
jgi:hypothetical protein